MRKTAKMQKKFGFLPYSKSQAFHQGTKLRKFLKSGHGQNDGPKEWFQVFYKGYPKFEKVPDSEEINLQNIKLLPVLTNRISARKFSDYSLNLNKLLTLLHYSAGTRKEKTKNIKRYYPSAGARYPLEVYFLNLKGGGLRRGAFHYHVRTGQLEYLWTSENFQTDVLNNFNQDWIRQSSGLIVISAVFWRNEMKYGSRGYRHIWMEAGALTQNIYLLSAALNVACCSIGGFIDDGINSLLDLDGVDESVLSVIAVGEFDK